MFVHVRLGQVQNGSGGLDGAWTFDVTNRALYHPFIHFRDEAWLKVNALYWDEMLRIVPSHYALHDSRDVSVLSDAGFVRNEEPGPRSGALEALFTAMLDRYQAELVERYDVRRCARWPLSPGARAGLLRGRNRRLAYVYVTKVRPGLRERLIRSRLAVADQGKQWLGMHPNLVGAYMTALATEISRATHAHPVTDQPKYMLAAATCTVDDLARALVRPYDLRADRPDSGALVAMVTLRAAIPSGLGSVRAEKIVRLRNEHPGARARFHEYVRSVTRALATADGSERLEVEEHARSEYRRLLEPEMVELRKNLRHHGIEAFLGSVAVGMTLPASAAGLLAAFPTAGVVAATSLGVAAVVHKQQVAARKTLRESPASYLFAVQRLQPVTLGKRLARSVQKFALDV